MSFSCVHTVVGIILFYNKSNVSILTFNKNFLNKYNLAFLCLTLFCLFHRNKFLLVSFEKEINEIVYIEEGSQCILNKMKIISNQYLNFLCNHMADQSIRKKLRKRDILDQIQYWLKNVTQFFLNLLLIIVSKQYMSSIHMK